MKLGTLTAALGDLPLDEACGFLAGNGVQMVEIGCGGFPGRPTVTRRNSWPTRANGGNSWTRFTGTAWRSAR